MGRTVNVCDMGAVVSIFGHLSPLDRERLLALAERLLREHDGATFAPCWACVYWRNDHPLTKQKRWLPGTGQCRRYAPRPGIASDRNGWPETYSRSWCGDGRQLTVEELAQRLHGDDDDDGDE